MALCWLVGALLLCPNGEPQNMTTFEELSSHIVFHTQGWGEMGINTAAHAPGMQPMSLQIKDKKYETGLGVHAPSETWIDLEGRYLAFESEIGIQRQEQGLGSVVFQVYVDGEKRFDSAIMTGNDAPRLIHIPLNGAMELKLVVTDAGDGIICDCANWAGAKLIPNTAVSATLTQLGTDMAPSAKVMTWDPSRKEGTHAQRTEEFPAEDICLGQEIVPDRDGTLKVPVDKDHSACIGLEWFERRFLRSLELQFADKKHMPNADKAFVEYWQGESPWQGTWKQLHAPIEAKGSTWLLHVDLAKNPDLRSGTEKIRWIVPISEDALICRKLSAYTRSQWGTTELRIELENPSPNETLKITAYNGAVADLSDSDKETSWGLSLTCDKNKPLALKVRYAAPRPWKTDRTVLRFNFTETAFGVAVDDIIANGKFYVPDAGFLIALKDSPVTLETCRETTNSKKTILREVREKPEQTRIQAQQHVHNPVQNNGPMMLSLACDNRKFIVDRVGSVLFDLYEQTDQDVGNPDSFRCKVQPHWGSVQPDQISRRLHGGWYPAPISEINIEGIRYRQTACVVPFDDKRMPDGFSGLREHALCVLTFEMENVTSAQNVARVQLSIWSNVKENRTPETKPADGGIVFVEENRLFAYVKTEQPGEFSLTETGIVWNKSFKPFEKDQFTVYLPAWDMKPEEYTRFNKKINALQLLKQYWDEVLANATHIEIPDTFLADVIRASQVHCLLAARNEQGGKRVAPWIASASYGPLESEANAVIRGMDLLGHEEFARRSLDYFLARYNEEGYLTTGYTIVGTGWNLWTLAEHYERARDDEWLRSVAPIIAKACDWIVRQRAKTQLVDSRGEKIPEYGLVPPGVLADWNRYAYRFMYEGHFCAGLREAAKALKIFGHPEAERFQKEADAFREDIRNAYRWNQQQSPVLCLKNGAWVPAYPGMLYCFGRIEDIIPGEDWNRTWAYDVELGAHHLAALGVLDPESNEVGQMLDHMEDFWFLHSGMGDYPAEKNQTDWFNLGGFAKVQPYYARSTELYALRDDVKPFIRSYFNAIFSLLNLETLSFWEHFHNIGAWNKTHETGAFLAQTRLLFVMERHDDLWLAPFAPTEWLADGKSINVENAPTRFGKTSFAIHSHLAKNLINVSISPPERIKPDHIVIRLRHPEGNAIEHVSAEGVENCIVDKEKQCVRVTPKGRPIRLSVYFSKTP